MSEFYLLPSREQDLMLSKMGPSDAKQGKYMGRTTKQIMMKNPIIQGIRKTLFKSSKIKEIVATAKQIESLVNDIDAFKNLCGPTKTRLR
jgi:hypothetical protein